MAALDSKIEFCNAALNRASSAAIASFETSKGKDAKRIYDALELEVLSLALWTFNTGTRKLNRLTQAPDVRYTYQFQLPEDRLDYPKAVYDSKTSDFPNGDYELGDGVLYGNFEECWVFYQRVLSAPDQWGAAMRAAAQTALAARFALTFNEDTSRYRTLLREAYGSEDVSQLEGQFGVAIQKEALSGPPVQALPDGGPLLAARSGGW